MAKMRNIYVVGFAPAHEGGGMGGFDWRDTFRDAVEVLRDHIADEHADECDYRLARVAVPADLDRDDVTAFLDENGDLWEPPGPNPEAEED